MDGYLADVYLIDGTAVGETSGYLDEFGEVKEGVWIPKNILVLMALMDFI